MPRLQSNGAAETERLGAELARRLRAGDVVLVRGDLGAGKTTFVRGAARELGVSGPVTSPTFTIGQRYPGPVPVSHLDLYRVSSLADEDPELLADYLTPETVSFVEWAPDAPAELEDLGAVRVVAEVRIEHHGEDRRMVEIELVAPR